VEGWIALAGVISGAVVGTAGLLFGWLGGKQERATTLELSAAQREHERQLARDNRLHVELREAYGEVVRFLILTQQIASQTMPIFGPMPDPPELPPQSEVQRILARASVVGSDEVMKAFDEASRRFQVFQLDAHALAQVQRQGGDDGDMWRRVEEARQSFLEQSAEVERLVREEVRG
jgi:hypothetical protein